MTRAKTRFDTTMLADLLPKKVLLRESFDTKKCHKLEDLTVVAADTQRRALFDQTRE
mgnify:FL=1